MNLSAAHQRLRVKASPGWLTLSCCLLAVSWILDGGAAFAKTGQSPVKRGASVGRAHAPQGKHAQESPPPDLWVRLRSRFSLAIPQPVRWPVSPGFAAVSMLARPLGDADFSGVSPIQGIPMRGNGRMALAPATAPGSEARPASPGFGLPYAGAYAALESATDVQAEWIRLERQQAAYERLNGQLFWLRRHLGFVRASVERATYFIHLVTEELYRYRVPLDFALLPIIESGFSPRAVSVKGASGLWQFMAATGDEYGLRRDEWFDERLDVPASTRGAARYLAFLGRKFNGDWLLAAAAYNAGIGRVRQAIEFNRGQGLPLDFWSLSLPQETMDYVPRLLALAAMFSRHGDYSLSLKPLPDQPSLARIRFERPLKFTELASLAGMSAEEFTHLNAGFIRDVLPTSRPSVILLPIEKITAFGWRMRLNDLSADAIESVLPDRSVYEAPALSGVNPFEFQPPGAY